MSCFQRSRGYVFRKGVARLEKESDQMEILKNINKIKASV